MKKLILLTTLLVTAAPYAKAEDSSVVGREDGVGAGGSGGNPHSFGVMSLLPPMKNQEDLSVNEVLSTNFKPAREATPTAVKSNEATITVNREELLKAVDAALNSTDIEMEVNEAPVTIRLKNFDLTRGILHGQVLETNKTIRLIDEAKALQK